MGLAPQAMGLRQEHEGPRAGCSTSTPLGVAPWPPCWGGDHYETSARIFTREINGYPFTTFADSSDFLAKCIIQV